MTTLLKIAAFLQIFIVGLSNSNKLIISASDQCFKSIISFGDSITDTGNAAYLVRNEKERQFYTLPPYGETFFGHPTGRCSDGRLIVDFLAEELGIPFVTPFHGRSVAGGGCGSVNFAVVGATALEDSFFRQIGVEIPMANASLTAQLSWFKYFLSKNCDTSSDYKRFLRSSLVLMGEIGGNDYNHAFMQGKTEAEVRSFVPNVIKVIGIAINELINLGAATLIVPGNFPIGCSSVYLTYFHSNNKQDYNSETGCITWLNRFSQYHNQLLEKELKTIQKLHPNTTIIYADYYNAAIGFFLSPNDYGFGGGGLRACCGAGGPYNVKLDVNCGNAGSQCCRDPSGYVNWDGLHLTQAAYKWVAKVLFQESNATTHLSSICAKNLNGGFYDS